MNATHANPHINGRRRPEEEIRGAYVHETLLLAPAEGQVQLHEVFYYAQQHPWPVQLQAQHPQAHVQQLQVHPKAAQLQVQQSTTNRVQYASLLRSQRRETARLFVAGADEAAHRTLHERHMQERQLLTERLQADRASAHAASSTSSTAPATAASGATSASTAANRSRSPRRSSDV